MNFENKHMNGSGPRLNGGNLSKKAGGSVKICCPLENQDMNLEKNILQGGEPHLHGYELSDKTGPGPIMPLVLFEVLDANLENNSTQEGEQHLHDYELSVKSCLAQVLDTNLENNSLQEDLNERDDGLPEKPGPRPIIVSSLQKVPDASLRCTSAQGGGKRSDGKPSGKAQKKSKKKSTLWPECPEGPITTLMIGNIPYRNTLQQMVDIIDALGFGGSFDLILVPTVSRTNLNLGYCFINFTSAYDAELFSKVFDGYEIQGRSLAKRASIKPARVQGFMNMFEILRRGKCSQSHAFTCRL